MGGGGWYKTIQLQPPSQSYHRRFPSIPRDYRRQCKNLPTSTSDRGGDFNAWATEWGSAKTNHRGYALIEAFSLLELKIANTGGKPTYSKAGKSSDLTFVDPKLMGEGLGWKVSDRYTGSDHQALVYQLQLTGRAARRVQSLRTERWAPATFDRKMFLYSLEEKEVKGTSEERARCLSRAITAACDASMAVKTNPRGRPPVYWWNEEIANIRRECLRARRLHQRAIHKPRYYQLAADYERKKKRLKIAIKAAKRKCWQDFCEEVDHDPWGRPYKTVMNKIKPRGPNAPSCPSLLDKVVGHLCPEAARRYRSRTKDGC
ncbi:hypothetical protein DD595_25020 [Enterobacter cloacae complex sp. 4DZ3-17B2]|uniref:hypothetical protein n=1 Tax=Enterobacter cloacae complex sp. 4DZ3-17B2 TaxID=2511990 RepID=UPI00101309A2|nr:hypothetical protein DD595_25020 [Enterobacter cloacae complex sp. 4DZ3-17B2]